MKIEGSPSELAEFIKKVISSKKEITLVSGASVRRPPQAPPSNALHIRGGNDTIHHTDM